ncbi:MAG TPA: VOC family protein [Vicinamibacterales bacterium]|nr:VOC family protein [Vicinamibacterales bacterium]
MQGFAATKLSEFEQGRISRRTLIETLTLAVTSICAADANAAQTAVPKGVKAALVNHVSYTCPNFKQAGDWYSKVFNLDQVGLKETEVTLPFGKKGEQPYNVAAKDVPLTFIICRTRDLNAPPANGAAPRPKPTAVINHIGYTVADFERNRVREQLKAMGVANLRDGGEYSLHMTDPFGYDVQISGLANNALTDV